MRFDWYGDRCIRCENILHSLLNTSRVFKVFQLPNLKLGFEHYLGISVYYIYKCSVWVLLLCQTSLEWFHQLPEESYLRVHGFMSYRNI